MKRWLVWFWMVCCAAPLWSAPRHALDEPRFARVGDHASIGDGVVTALAEDDLGFVWVGTPVGLVRYDGYQMRQFAVGDTPAGHALPRARFVRSLLAAPGGVLWVGLEGEGLARLDSRRQRWTLYAADPSQAGALRHGSVRALALDAQGVLWVGTTGGGLHSLAPGGDRFTHHSVASGDLPDDRVQALRVDQAGNLWVGTWRGLVRKAAGSQVFEPAFSDPGGDGLAGQQVSMLGVGPDGQVWAGTRAGGLALIDAASGAGRWVDRGSSQDDAGAEPQATGPGGSVSFVVAGTNEVWVGRDRALDVRDAGTGRLVQRLQRSNNKPWGLAGHNVVALLRDAAGQLWVGSYGGGLQRHLPSAGVWVRRGEGAEGSAFEDADVRSLHQLRNGEVWAGTPAGAVVVLGPDLALRATLSPVQPFRPLAAGAAPGAASPPALSAAPARVFGGGLVGAITQAADGVVWVGSDSGIYAFDDQRRLLRRLAMDAGRTRRLLAAADGSVWAGTQDGVHRLAPDGRRFERLDRADGQPLSGNVSALVQAADGTVWVGANAGLWRVRPGSRQLQAVVGQTDAPLRNAVVLGLLVDSQQRLWVDTNGGLFLGRQPGQDTPQFERMAAQGAAQSFGANLLEDGAGRIWTHQNLFDPRSGEAHALGPADGVDIGTGWFRSYTALADGRLLFGGSTGILVLEPQRLQRWTFQPPIAVTDLRVNGERQPPDRLQPALVLQPGQRSFSVEFAALDLTQPERNRYRYRLHGFDTDWVETGADFRVASYGNLPPGHYRLALQGSNRSGQWSQRTLDLAVQVVPAWWQTWLARGGLALVLVAAVWALVQLRTRLLRQRQSELEQKVRERTLALETLSMQLRQQSAALEAASLTDPLTGLNNRRFLSQQMAADVALAARLQPLAEPLTEPLRGVGMDMPAGPTPPEPTQQAAGHGGDIVFLLIDIDHFKEVNDQHGHGAGDAVLLQVVQRLKTVCREADYLVRWGGEEFLLVARSTDRARAPDIAERARHAIAHQPFVLDDGTLLHKTCSVGFAAFPMAPGLRAALDWSTTVDLADAALYRVKRGGRDGWFGLVQADAANAAALRQAAAAPLGVWLAQGTLKALGSRPFAGD